jgi:MoxR-like ATPase
MAINLIGTSNNQASDIRAVCEYIQARFGAVGFAAIEAGEQRRAFESLAIACGYPEGGTKAISDADLLALYGVCLRKPESGAQVADRIARKHLVSLDKSKAPSAPVAPSNALQMDYVTRDTFDKWSNHMDKAMQQERASIGRMMDTATSSIPSLISEALDKLAPVRIEVKTPQMVNSVSLGHVHYAMERIIRALGAGLNVYLHGPAGSGKTTAGRKCAEAFGVPFYTAAKVESEYLLLGFKDARGETVHTQFREAYEHGGVFLFDELDASAPGAVVALNMALANGICPFPDGNVTRHANFYCIAAGNTRLTGATRQYAGRSQLDAASVDRFYFIEFGYDEALETALAPNKLWARHVQAIRKAVADRGLDHLVTPRATLDGCKALEMGDTWEQAEDACIFKGLDPDTADQIRRAVGGGTADIAPMLRRA